MKTMIKPHIRIEGKETALYFDSLKDYKENPENNTKFKYAEHRDLPTLFGFYIPDFQRELVWTMQQKVRFVESVFLGFDLGRIVISTSQWEKRHLLVDNLLIDGQQRLHTLNEFMDGKFGIFNDICFEDIKSRETCQYPEGWYEWQHPGEAKQALTPWNHWKRASFPMTVIELDSMDTARELYNRLNFGGTPHTPDQMA